MAANYLHGVETLKTRDGNRPVRLVKSAVTGAVCTAPTGPVNMLVPILSERAAAQFGGRVAGFSAGYTLDANFSAGMPTSGVVMMVNVCDPARHRSAENDVPVAFDPVKLTAQLPAVAIQADTLVVKAGATEYTQGTDYTVAPLTGVLTRVPGGTIPANASGLTASYIYTDPTQVTAADVIGGVDAAGRRSGMQLCLDAYAQYGYFPKRLVCPGFSPLASVSAEMISIANRIRARAYIDAPIGITPMQAISGRGPMGSINFNTSAARAVLCYPHVQVYDTATNSNVLEPLSVHRAALGNAVDIEYGYWYSPSNFELTSVLGLERLISAAPNDPNSEANALNEVGICTVLNSFGTGFRAWGNRTAAWPSDTYPDNFEAVLAVGDIIDESIEYFTLQFIDRPGTPAWIDAVCESVNAFLRKLRADGALIDGRCWFDAADNSPEEMANGHYVFSRDYMPPTPAERVTHKTQLNINYLKALYARAA